MNEDYSEFPQRLADFMAKHGCVVPDSAILRCTAHLQVLSKWNRVMNLVGDLSLDTAVSRHYGEGLFLASLLPGSFAIVADIGSGGGFPGAPIAAYWPDRHVVLVESRLKKATFLRESTRDWGNCSVFAGLAESMNTPVECLTARGVDVSLVTALAIERNVALAMLVATDTARATEKLFTLRNRRSCVVPIPWRPQAAVVLVERQ